MALCLGCGSDSLLSNSHYGQEQVVCLECGLVADEGHVANLLPEELQPIGSTFVADAGDGANITRCLQHGLQKIREICKVLGIPQIMEDAAKEHYRTAFLKPLFHYVKRPRKDALAGCCVYAACRCHCWPISVMTASQAVQVTPQCFSQMYLSLVQELGLQIPQQNMPEMIRSFCSRLQETVNVKWNLAKRTIQICELCGEAWLLTGRRPMPAIIAATFLAWQSLYPRSPICVSLKSFCRNSGTPYSTSVRARVQEMRKLLLALAQTLPWLIHRRLSLVSVVKFIDEVLSNQMLLLRQLASQDSQMLQVQSDSPVLLNTTNIDVFKTKCGNPAPSLLLPPCILAPKKPSLEPERCQQPFSNEISEAEIEQYIRTPEEVEEIQRFQAAILNS